MRKITDMKLDELKVFVGRFKEALQDELFMQFCCDMAIIDGDADCVRLHNAIAKAVAWRTFCWKEEVLPLKIISVGESAEMFKEKGYEKHIAYEVNRMTENPDLRPDLFC